MTPQRPQPRAHRSALGSELRRLRALSGVSGRDLARRVEISQSTVSRIENGELAPNLPQVRAWATATDASPEDLTRLEWLAEQALNEVIPFRQWRDAAGLGGMQAEIRTLEQAARYVANFQPCFVPGLLQTGEYAMRVLATTGGDGHEGGAMARLERQEILADRSRRFEFVMTEAALHWRSGPAGMLVAQLHRIANVATFRNVTVGVIPLDADMLAAPTCAFVLYEDRDDGEKALAAVETPHSRLEVTDDVQAYRDELDLLRRSAVFGETAITFLLDLAARLG
jgi:transcriptional regulator with XRE-family HTH domain